MANIVVTSHYTWGDVLPFLRLSERLKKRGHQVTLITHGAFEEMAIEAGIGFTALDLKEEYHQLLKDIGMMGDPINNPDGYEDFNDKYHSKEQLLYEYHLIAQQCISDDTILVARHRSSISAYLVSEKLGIPLVPVFLAPTYIYHLPAQDELIGDYQVAVVNSVREELGLAPIESWHEWMCSIKKCIGFWPKWFAQQGAYGPFEVTAAGFPLDNSTVNSEIPEEVEKFLEEGEPPILVTGGTSMLLKSNFYEVSVEACKLSNHRAILVCEHKELIPDELPDFIRWYKFLPLDSILDRMKLIIHHGGIGTIGGSTRAAIPQLALAADTDRPDNAMRIKDIGIGEYLPPIQWKPDLIAEKLKSLMTQEVQNQCRAISEEMIKKNALDIASEVIESSIRNNELIAKGKINTVNTSIIPHQSLDVSEVDCSKNAKVLSSVNELSQDRKSALLQMLRKKMERGNST